MPSLVVRRAESLRALQHGRNKLFVMILSEPLIQLAHHALRCIVSSKKILFKTVDIPTRRREKSQFHPFEVHSPLSSEPQDQS